MLKTKRIPGDPKTVIALIGHIGGESLPALKAEIDAVSHDVALELDEVTLVDVDVIHFFIECQARGIELRGCSAYIREWIAQEENGKA